MPAAPLPILYSFRRCPYAMRARMALAVSGQSCELREVVLRDKPAALLDASAKGTVPVLIDVDGRVIDESLDIMKWALARSDPARWMAPERGSLDEMLQLIARCDDEFKQHLDRYKYPGHYQSADARAHRKLASSFVADLNDRLVTAAFLFGGRAALADIAIMPFVRQFASTDTAWFTAQAWPSLQAWLSALAESELFRIAMSKYPVWQPGTRGALFPPHSQF